MTFLPLAVGSVAFLAALVYAGRVNYRAKHRSGMKGHAK